MASLVLDSAPITIGQASTGLGYDRRRRHTAAVLWTDPRHPDQAALAQVDLRALDSIIDTDETNVPRTRGMILGK